jgi:hypothetical protein
VAWQLDSSSFAFPAPARGPPPDLCPPTATSPLPRPARTSHLPPGPRLAPHPQRGVALPGVAVSEDQIEKALAQCMPVATLSPGAWPAWRCAEPGGGSEGSGGGGRGLPGVLRRAARLAQTK